LIENGGAEVNDASFNLEFPDQCEDVLLFLEKDRCAFESTAVM